METIIFQKIKNLQNITVFKTEDGAGLSEAGTGSG